MLSQTLVSAKRSLRGNLVFVKIGLASWIPSILLSGLVLGVFWVARGFGPESALRAFHIAAVNNDREGMREACVENASEQALGVFAQRIGDIARAGGQYKVRGVHQRKEDLVIAEVNYSGPFSQRAVPTLFIVRKVRSNWLVDPDATLQLMIDAMRSGFAP
jgi:hypothetical protein